MNPTPTTTTPNPTGPAAPAAQPVVEFIRTKRQTAAYILLGLSAVFLVATIALFARGLRTETKPADTPAAADPLNPDANKPQVEIADPKSRDYKVGGIGALVGFLVTAVSGAWLMVGLPKPTVERQRAEARAAVLSVGGLLGLALILFGAWFFYLWSDSLTNWLDKGETKEMRWVVIPLLMVVAGAGLVFTAVQPARAEERNNQTLRKLVYGSNLGLTVLLLFVLLVVANVAFAVRVPSRLDTTTSGFYSLSDPTKAFLGQLDQPVTAYAILRDSGDRVTDDIRRLLESCEDAGGGRFKVKYINPQLNRADLAALRAKYTQLEVNDTGVLLVVGDDAQKEAGPPGRYTFIREEEFLDRESSAMRQGPPAFAGEVKLVRELMFLAENRQKPVVYFAQSAGELDVNGSGDRGASQLKAFLEKNYLDIRSHKFDPVAPKVPDDADILVFASPRTTVPPAVADAVKKYMAEPRAGGKKGKLVVLAGAPDPATATKVPPTGLEGVLAEFNITIGNRYIFGIVGGQIARGSLPATFAEEAVRAKNPVAMTLRRFQMSAVLPREVVPVAGGLPGGQGGGNPAYKATRILETLTDYAWFEDEWPSSINQMIAEVRKNPAGKQMTEFKSVGVLASESSAPPPQMPGHPPVPGGTGAARVAVFGTGFIASDAWAQETRGTAPVEFDLIGVTLDWLRDRPPVPTGITAKTYNTYTFPPKVDTTRLLWFPLGLSVLVVAGLGAGVWVIRRK